MPDRGYLISCAISSLGGLIVGLSLGSILNGSLGVWVRRFWREVSRHSPALIALLVALVVTGSMVMVFLQARKLDRVTACQSLANESFREALAARSLYSEGQRTAQLDQIRQQIAQNESQAALLAITVRGDRAASDVAIREYTVKLNNNTAALREVAQALAETQNATAQNPLPQLKCGIP